MSDDHSGARKSLICPKCTAEMERIVVEQIEVDRCTNCKGLFFDNREDEKLRERKLARVIDIGDRKQSRSYDAMRSIRCPRCNSQMVRMNDVRHPELAYENCAVCGGVFFDAGEFRTYASGQLWDAIRKFLSWEP